MSTEYFQGFGMVSLNDGDIKLFSNGWVELTFVVRSSDPQALDIVSKVATGMYGVSYVLKNRGLDTVTFRARVTDSDHFSITHPLITDFFHALRSKINGVTKVRVRPNGLRIF